MVIKKLLKSALLLATAGAAIVGSSAAFFTASTTVSGNQITVGKMGLSVVSSRTHTTASTWNGGVGLFGVPFDSYVASQYVNGVTTSYNPLEPWQNAEPGLPVAYSNTAGADADVPGNKSWWVGLLNDGTITSKVKANISSGSWTLDAGVAASPACIGFVPSASVITVNNVTLYGTTGGANICKSHEECENIYYGLVSQGKSYSSDTDIAGADVNVTTPTGSVYATSTGLSTGSEIALSQNQFVIARVDASFDTSSPCYQGATFTYDLTASAYQLADGTW